MTKTVNEEQLARIARQRKFDPRTLEIARRLFIHHEKPKLLSAEYGVILQRVYAIRKAVLDSALQIGYAELNLRGPAEAVAAARLAYEKQMAKLKRQTSRGDRVSGRPQTTLKHALWHCGPHLRSPTRLARRRLVPTMRPRVSMRKAARAAFRERAARLATIAADEPRWNCDWRERRTADTTLMGLSKQ